MLVMTSGCLCCSIRGDLIATLEDILRRRDNGRIAPFQRVMIETTGLADPAPVLHTVMAHPYLMLRFRAQALARAGEATRSAAEAEELSQAKDLTGAAAYDLACVYSLCAGVIRRLITLCGRPAGPPFIGDAPATALTICIFTCWPRATCARPLAR